MIFSDDESIVLHEVENKCNITKRPKLRFKDPRNQKHIPRSVESLITQRMMAVSVVTKELYLNLIYGEIEKQRFY